MKKSGGYMLVEILVAISVMGLIFWSLLLLQAALIRAKNDGITKVQAAYRAVEAIEAVRRIRDRDGWLAVPGDSGQAVKSVEFIDNDWTLSDAPEGNIDGLFDREVVFDPVHRSAATGEITENPADPYDADTRKISTVITWDGGNKNMKMEAYLTNWK